MGYFLKLNYKAYDCGITTDYYGFIFTSLDLMRLKDFNIEINANITVLEMLKPNITFSFKTVKLFSNKLLP